MNVSENDRQGTFPVARRRARWRRAKRLLIIIHLSLALLAVGLPNPACANAEGAATEPGEAAERYALPISPPMDQGDSDLCWVFATLSMLETNYMVRRPGSGIELSRGALQFDSIADRFRRRIRGEPIALEDGGLAVEALALVRQNGLLSRDDFHGIVDSDPIFPSIEHKLARTSNASDKQAALDEALRVSLGAKPPMTHLDGETLSPAQLARAVLGDEEWTEFDLSRDGAEGWGPSKDPDARPDTRVRYVKLEVMVELIHQSLARGEAVVWGSTDHALLIYGGDYDRDGKPLSYLIKDSFAPYTYRASAEKIHRILHDVTVALPDSVIEMTSRHGDGAACLAGGCEGKLSGPPKAIGAP